MRLNEWCAISASVDTLVGVMHVYVNGQLSCSVKGPQLCKDGQHAIKRRLALLWTKDDDPSPEECAYVRSVAVHSVVLDAEQVRTTPPRPPLLLELTAPSLPIPHRPLSPPCYPPPLPGAQGACRSTHPPHRGHHRLGASRKWLGVGSIGLGARFPQRP